MSARLSRRSAWAAVLLCLSLSAVPAQPVRAEGELLSRSRWSEAVGAFVSTLDEDQKQSALYAFDDGERFDLRLAPLGLEGLRIDEMTDAQWAELESLLGNVLSPTGVTKMNTIRSLEREVAEIEGGLFGFLMNRIRNTKRYFLAIFGNPNAGEVWGMRFDGHHFSFNWTAAPDQPLSVTPVFWGGQPRVVPDGLERAGLRVMAEEEERAIELLNVLTPVEQDAARLAFTQGSGIRRPMSISGEVPLELAPPAGLARNDMSPEARNGLDRLIDLQLENFSRPVAAHYRSRIAKQAETIHFAFAAPDSAETHSFESGRPLYYRVQSSTVLIEYDNTSKEADHIHVVWRDLESDFGRDVLGLHLAKGH